MDHLVHKCIFQLKIFNIKIGKRIACNLMTVYTIINCLHDHLCRSDNYNPSVICTTVNSSI